MKVFEVCNQVLNDLKAAIKLLSTEQYNKSIDLLFKASIGQHSRHIIEFFQCLEAQLENSVICYDKRLRNINIEQNPAVAIQVIEEIQAWLNSNPNDCALTLLANHELEEDDDNATINSSLIRELYFNIEHAIHHMAIIKIGAKLAFPNVQLPEHFGVAPSTIRYQKKLEEVNVFVKR